MNPIQTSLFSALLSTSLLSAEPLYTREGTDPSFADILKGSGVKVGDTISQGPVLGSRIQVNHELLEQPVGKSGSIPKDTDESYEVNQNSPLDHTRWKLVTKGCCTKAKGKN